MLTATDRDEALKEDYTFDPGSFDYGVDDEWGDEDATWNEEEGQQQTQPEQQLQSQSEPTSAQDESQAYLEFLSEEV